MLGLFFSFKKVKKFWVGWGFFQKSINDFSWVGSFLESIRTFGWNLTAIKVFKKLFGLKI